MSELKGRVDIAARILGDLAEIDAPLGALTTYRVGGRAAVAVRPTSGVDLDLVSIAHRETGLPVLVVGNGSNMLVSDAGFDGIAVVMAKGFDGIEIEGSTVTAGAGVSLPVLARRTVAAGLTRFEWAVGVPGTVGGAVRMNAGGHGSDISETLESAHTVDLSDGGHSVLSSDQLEFGYRTSSITAAQVVLSATLSLEIGDTDKAQERLSEIVHWRREHQPGGQNAGSCFRNPQGSSAGFLIDSAGLKGLRVGSAYVHEKHANFIQAEEGGSAQDVHDLIREVQHRVKEESGIQLHTEVRLVGNFRTDVGSHISADQDSET